MLTIRLQRTGKKNLADFRIVLAQKAAHVSKKIVDILGSYNPHKKTFTLKNPEKIEQLLKEGASMSPTINNLFIEKGIIKGDKVKAFNIPKKEVVAEAPATEAPAEAAVETPAAPSADAPAAEVAPEQPTETPAE